MDNFQTDMLSRRRRDALVLLLACAAGSVDAIGYLGLNHVFTANMTGNTVLLGVTLGQGRGLAAWSNITALAGFGFGLLFGALIVEHHGKAGVWDRRVTWAISLEGFLLAAFTALWHLTPADELRGSGLLYLLIIISAAAMGVQSAAVRRLNLPGVATTYVTGTLTSLIAGLAHKLHLAWSTPEGNSASATPGIVRLQASVFAVYGASALLSGFFQTHAPALVAVLPLLAVGVVLLLVSSVHIRQDA